MSIKPVQDAGTQFEIHTLDDILAQHRETNSFRLIKSSAAMAAADSGEMEPEKLSEDLKKFQDAPSSTAIAAIPPSASAEDRKNLSDILLLNSYVSVASMRYLYKIHPQDWDITNPVDAANFTKAGANAKFKVLTDGLGSFLTLDTASTRSFNESTTSADLHLSFLGSLFDGFGFPGSTMKELDGVLTSVTQTLSDLRLSWSDQSSTLDHLVFFYYFDEVPGLGMKLPSMRLFYLHIDQSSWTASVGKSSITHFQFSMNFDDNIFNMNPDQVDSNRDAIKNLLSTMTGQSFDAINDMLSPKAVKDRRS